MNKFKTTTCAVLLTLCIASSALAGNIGLPRTGNIGLPAKATGNIGLPANATGNIGLPSNATGNIGLPSNATGNIGLPRPNTSAFDFELFLSGAFIRILLQGGTIF